MDFGFFRRAFLKHFCDANADRSYQANFSDPNADKLHVQCCLQEYQSRSWQVPINPKLVPKFFVTSLAGTSSIWGANYGMRKFVQK